MLQTGGAEKSKTHDLVSSAEGCQASFLFLRSYFLLLIIWHSLNLNFISFLPYVSTSGRREGARVQARTSGKGSQADRMGQEQGTDKSGRTVQAVKRTGGASGTGAGR